MGLSSIVLAAVASQAGATACADLTKLKLDHVAIVAATFVDAGGFSAS